LAEQKECRIEEGHLMPDHVHMLIATPPKYSVAQVIGFLKGKAAIHIARTWCDENCSKCSTLIEPIFVPPFQSIDLSRFIETE
jgi:REP element-mobilizing transposase RayT